MGLAKTIGQTVLKKLAPQGLPIDTMISIARRAGGGYRYQEMRNDARVYSGKVKYQTLIERLGYDNRIPEAWQVSNDLKEQAKYRVFGKVTMYDEESGRYLTKNASFYTNELGTVGEMGGAFWDYYYGKYEEEELLLTEFKATGVEVDPHFTI